MHELLLSDRVKGEREIALFRIVLLCLLAVMVALIAFDGRPLTLSDMANMGAIGVAFVYTAIILFVIESSGYRRAFGYLSATVDVLLVSVVTYLSRYAPDSSVASIVSSSSFAAYFPIILFSVRRHDPWNTLYSGLLAALGYGVMIAIMEAEGSFGLPMLGPGGLRIKNDILNEGIKALILAVTGLVGFGASRRFDSLFAEALSAVREKESIRDMFGRYVSDELVEKIMAKEIDLGGEKREVTVMFIDIRNFTSLAEKADPHTLIAILNNFFSLSIATITAHGGFIDKFIGDAIMVVFGAPEASEDHCSAAIACAVDLAESLRGMDAWVREQGVDWQFGYGIGINTGEAIVGNIGTERRMEYTALGDAVNVASRLEHLTRQLERPILVGAGCAKACAARTDRFSFEGPYRAQLKGKSETVELYAVRNRLLPADRAAALI